MKEWIFNNSEFTGPIGGLHVRNFVEFPYANLIKNYPTYTQGAYYRDNRFKAIDYLLSVIYLFGRCRAIEDLDTTMEFDNPDKAEVSKEIENDYTDTFKKKISLGTTVFFYKMPVMDKLYKGIVTSVSFESVIVKDEMGKLFSLEWEEIYKAVV